MARDIEKLSAERLPKSGEILGNYMRYHGVYMPDLHMVFTSAAHTEEDADRIVEAFKTSLREMREDGLF